MTRCRAAGVWVMPAGAARAWKVAPAVPAEFLVFRLLREGGGNAVVEVIA